MTRQGFGIVALGLVLALGSAREGIGQDREAPRHAPEELLRTQLTVHLTKGDERARFRATVLEQGRDGLVIMTAAHCLAADDVGRPLVIQQGEAAAEAEVVGVVRNPSYQQTPFGDSPGADNAIARLRLKSDDPRAATLLRGLQAAEVTESPIPGPNGETLSVRAIDQQDREHFVRSGNYSNPKWLEWGRSYTPIPGDSGGGVFILQRGEDGQPVPLLIGVVVVRSSNGGGASLVSREQGWIDHAGNVGIPAP